MICPSCKTPNDRDADNCIGCGRGLFALVRGDLLSKRYEILGALGRGGMGMVYKAHDRELDEVVAVKVLRSGMSADAIRRFRAEIKLARRVRHVNVCAIHESGQDAHRRYIVMEYIEGEDLKHLLRARSLTAHEAFDVAAQVARGLQAIHEMGIVHRDLKTANIMRGTSGHVRVMDFGIAKQFELEATTGVTRTGMLVGTPEYMSPEQTRGDRVDPRSDLYALGIVVYELFVGSVPFRGETYHATLLMHMDNPPPLEKPSLPAPLVPVLRKALAKNRVDRYASALEMAEALAEARAQLSLPAHGWTPEPGLLSVDRDDYPSSENSPTPTALRPNSATESMSEDEAVAEGAVGQGPVTEEVTPSRDSPVPWHAKGPADGHSPETHRREGSSWHVSRRAASAAAVAAVLIVGGWLLWDRAPSTTRVEQGQGKPGPAPAANDVTTPEPNSSAGRPASPMDTPPETLESPSLTPGTPRLLAPPDRAVFKLGDPALAKARLVWRAVLGAVEYRLLVDTDPSFARPVMDRSGLKKSTIELPNLAAGRYYWRVVGVGKDGIQGPFSVAARFTIAPADQGTPSPVTTVTDSTEPGPPAPESTTRVGPATQDATASPPSPEEKAPGTDARSKPQATPSEDDDRIRSVPDRSVPASGPPGTLEVKIKPWAMVAVDGASRGKAPPLAKITLSPGLHKLVFTHPNFEPLSRVVEIHSGVVERLKIDLADEAVRRRP